MNKGEITLSALTIHREFIASDYSAHSEHELQFLEEASKGENASRSRTVGDPSHLSDRNIVSIRGVVHA